MHFRNSDYLSLTEQKSRNDHARMTQARCHPLFFLPLVAILIATWLLPVGAADLSEMGSLEEEQVKERAELQDMKGLMSDIKKEMSEAGSKMEHVTSQLSSPQLKEFHLVAKESHWEILPGITVAALTYNSQVPGPVIKVEQGDTVRIVLHNQLRVPTSLYFHGLPVKKEINGLPRRQAGLLAPGDTYTYQFIAERVGTFWYHPQVIHADQIFSGLAGALVIEPRNTAKSYSKDYVLIIGQWEVNGHTAAQTENALKTAATLERPLASAAAKTQTDKAVPVPPTFFFTLNGKSAPAIAPIEVREGDRVRLRVINVTQRICPLFLTGHRFEIIATNGSDQSEVFPKRDTITLAPGDRYDLEFIADNPGVWSLSSLLPTQTANGGSFPGGVACVVRYQNSTH